MIKDLIIALLQYSIRLEKGNFFMKNLKYSTLTVNCSENSSDNTLKCTKNSSPRKEKGDKFNE
jgi:hypothetical protein